MDFHGSSLWPFPLSFITEKLMSQTLVVKSFNGHVVHASEMHFSSFLREKCSCVVKLGLMKIHSCCVFMETTLPLLFASSESEDRAVTLDVVVNY